LNDSPPIIAVDGPSGAGKGVVASFLSKKFDFHLLDSGALYRLVGIAARTEGVDLEVANLDQAKLGKMARNLKVEFVSTDNHENPLEIKLFGKNVTREVRTNEAGVDASRLASLPEVRRGLFELQRAFLRTPGLVADGRDMGTTIFPEADVKIYLTASVGARSERRYNQLKHKGINVSLRALTKSLEERDKRDTQREDSPLRPAKDAVIIDSTKMGVDDVLHQVNSIVNEKLG
jgi:cytidylate kinase